MTLNELMKAVKKKYKCTLWQKSGKCRIYFNHTSKIDTFLELEVSNGNVINISPKWYYKGEEPNSFKWLLNYSSAAREYIEDIALFATSLIEDDL